MQDLAHIPTLSFESKLAPRVASEPSSGRSSGGASGTLGFLEHLARALHVHGCPAHQLEDTLGRVAAHYGVEAAFFSTPTAVFADVTTAAGRSTRLLRMEPGEADLARLRAIDELIGRVVAGTLTPAEGESALRELERHPPVWGPVAEVASFSLASGAAARFLGGGPGDLLAGSAVGLAVGLLHLALKGRRESRRVYELLAAALAAGLALATSALGALGPEPFAVSAAIVTVAGLIVLVPGMTLTLAMTELATRNLVSGSARLAGAAVVLFTIGFGVAVGDRVARLGLRDLLPPTGPAQPSLAPWAGPLLDAIALVAIAAAFTVLFKARPRDIGWMFLASALAWQAIRVAGASLGPGLGALAASFVVGLAGNLVSSRLGRPAALLHVPGLMLLVPGSLGLRSLGSLLADDTLAGIQGLVDTSLTAVALATGLLLSHALLSPRRGL